MDTTLIAAVIGAVAVIVAAIIGIVATRRRQVDLRLVELALQESENAHPKIEITLRNVGTEIVFLKRAEFKILKRGMYFPQGEDNS